MARTNPLCTRNQMLAEHKEAITYKRSKIAYYQQHSIHWYASLLIHIYIYTHTSINSNTLLQCTYPCQKKKKKKMEKISKQNLRPSLFKETTPERNSLGSIIYQEPSSFDLSNAPKCLSVTFIFFILSFKHPGRVEGT